MICEFWLKGNYGWVSNFGVMGTKIAHYGTGYWALVYMFKSGVVFSLALFFTFDHYTHFFFGGSAIFIISSMCNNRPTTSVQYTPRLAAISQISVSFGDKPLTAVHANLLTHVASTLLILTDPIIFLLVQLG